VEALFAALCDASALNPDSDMEEEGGAQLFFDEAEVGLHARTLVVEHEAWVTFAGVLRQAGRRGRDTVQTPCVPFCGMCAAP
jgi:hypothetical protein